MIGCLHPAHSSALTVGPSSAVVAADAEAADAGDDVTDDVTTSGAAAASDATEFSVMSVGDCSAVYDNVPQFYLLCLRS